MIELGQFSSFRFAIAGALALYLAVVLIQRFRSSNDPSFRLQQSTGGGSVAFLVSGSMLTLMGVVAIIALTWPLAVNSPVLLGVLFSAVAIHYALEKMEVEMS